MNKYDQVRKDDLVKALCNAKGKAETVKLYLVANERSEEDINAASLAIEHVEIALEHLGALVT